MTVGENVTWALIGAAALAYMGARRMEVEKEQLAAVPSAQREVDPTRWRHDGTQGVAYRDGNKRVNTTFPEAENLYEMLAY